MKKAAADINNIWIITREYGDLAGAGGVKDVARQLAMALAKTGHAVSVVLPLYGFMAPEHLGFSRLELNFDLDMSYPQEERREGVAIWHQKSEIDIYLIDAPRFREKSGIYTYTSSDEAHNPFHRQGTGHYDYFAMNVLLQKAALCLIIALAQKPDIIHCHDGHTALIPAMVREVDGFRHYFNKTGLVVTIHNAGQGYHQEIGDLAFARVITGLPKRVIDGHLLDGNFDPFLAAASYAEMNTVSENYARELRETADDALTGFLGHALLKRGVILQGVTNGIDPTEFDLREHKKLGLPTDFQPGIASPPLVGSSKKPSVRSKGPSLTEVLSGKDLCKQDLCAAIARHSLTGVRQNGSLAFQPDHPLFTFIGRLSTQKGVDIMVEALRHFLSADPTFQVLILGNGQKEIEESLIEMTRAPGYQGKICLLRGFDHILANRVYAAGDFFLIPSKYEPCGLTDFIAQLFGNLPIVHHVGGLVKVVDGETGFAYQQHSGAALVEAMQRALDTYHSSRPAIMAMQRAAVALIHARYTWGKVMNRYLDLYSGARAKRLSAGGTLAQSRK
ncbi:MAG: glycogen/starch synthase [Desulfobulbaceae bacterium]|nr:glycogen/starch synthase [Desulfobulbaceae bacterium]